MSGSENGAKSAALEHDPSLLEAEELYRKGNVRAALTLLSSRSGDGGRRQIVEAMARFDLGDVTTSMTQLAKVVGDDRNDLKTRFDASLALFLRASDFESHQELLPSLTDLRQLAARVGSATTLALLHLAVARVEGLRGHLNDSHRHLNLSRQLAELENDNALQCSLDLVEASLECTGGNLVRSKYLAERCRQRALSSRFSKYLLGSATNLAVVALYEGQIDRATRYFDQVLPETPSLTYVRLGALDSLAQLHLHQGRFKDVAALLDDIAEVSHSDKVPARSWYDLAHQLTRCAYFERVREWATVVEIADATEPELARRQYKAVRASLLCVKARALARLGDHDEAEAALGRAMRHCPRSAVDPLIVLEASQAVCATLRGESSVGSTHFQRALAGCRAIGHRYHEHWISLLIEELKTSGRLTKETSARQSDAASVGLVLTDVATILGAGHSIDLMAHRTVALLQGTTLGPRVTVTSESGCEYQADPSASSETGADGTFVLQLRGSDRLITIRVARAESLDDIAMLKSVTDLVQTAVTRPSDGNQDDDDQNLWPKTAIDSDEDSVFRSPRMIELLKIARRIAATHVPVLITGETGTGKDVFARLIHEHSRHRRGPFMPFNCSAVSRELVESQLFGHRRGAFTGATESVAGVIRSAERGTLFLDEVGDLDLAVQPKLLRFLESGEIHTVGEPRPQHVPVRLVAATNADLETLISQGRFRRDLFYRLGVMKLVLPALRERKDEIPALASLFLAKASRQCGRTGLRLTDDFVAALLLYDWPGNIRELSNEIARVVALASDGDALGAKELAPEIAQRWLSRPTLVAPNVAAGPGFFVRSDQPLAQAINQLEEQFIAQAMHTTGGRVAEAAQLLGLSRKGLFLKRRRRGLTAAPAMAAGSAKEA